MVLRHLFMTVSPECLSSDNLSVCLRNACRIIIRFPLSTTGFSVVRFMPKRIIFIFVGYFPRIIVDFIALFSSVSVELSDIICETFIAFGVFFSIIVKTCCSHF